MHAPHPSSLPRARAALVAASALAVLAAAPPARAERVASAPRAAGAEPAPALDPQDLRTLTADPLLGKADRVDGDEAKGVVAFTFDDGPNPDTTPRVIDALLRYDVPATFFIVTKRLLGKSGARSRELLARLVAGGFELGSHSVSHPVLRGASAKTLAKEIDGSLRTLAPEAGRPIGLFRPPFGAFSKTGAAHLHKLGLTDVRWSVDTLDWKAKNADRLRKKVMAMILAQHGGVVLMHDVKPITAEVIAGVLDDLEAENCRRLAAGGEPIVPVSIHYFLKDGKAPRAIPPAVAQRTAAYRTALPVRCASRLPPAATPAPAR